MQEPALLHMLDMEHNIPVAAPARGRHNVLVKRKGDKHDDDQEVDDGADGAHALGYLPAVVLAHVDALETGLDEGRAQPADQRKRRGKREPAERERRNERLAIALEGVGEHGDAGGRDGEETERLGAGERRRRHDWESAACMAGACSMCT